MTGLDVTRAVIASLTLAGCLAYTIRTWIRPRLSWRWLVTDEPEHAWAVELLDDIRRLPEFEPGPVAWPPVDWADWSWVSDEADA